MALICAILAIIVTVYELRAGVWRPALSTKFEIALAVPKIWLRWQKNYLFGAPVIVAISVAYAHHVGLTTFWNIEPIG